MAAQGMERREILRVLALAAGASGVPGFHRWAFACGHGAPDVITLATAYTPKFFTADEYLYSRATRVDHSAERRNTRGA